MKRLNINLHDDIYQDLQQSAQENGQSKTYIVEKALKQYFEQSTDQSTSMQIEQSTSDNKEDDNSQNSVIEDILERLSSLEYNQQDHAKRLDKQDQRYQDNARDIGKLEKCYPEIKEHYKAQKEDISQLKHDVGKIKINHVSSQQHYKLQEHTEYLKSLFYGLSCPIETDQRDQNESLERDHDKKDGPGENQQDEIIDDGISLTAMGERINGISRNTIERIVIGKSTSQDSKNKYNQSIEPYFYWDSETNRFYPK